MRRRKNARPVLESMESKHLLSAQGVAATAALIAPMPLHLIGSAQGHYTEGTSNPDAGKTINFSGAGKVGPLGKVQFSGQLGTTGFIASGHAVGTLTLANAKGTVTLALTGPIQPGFSAPPTTFHYTATGTGVYAHDTGSGSLTIGLVASPAGGHHVSLRQLGSGRVTIHFG